MPHSVPAVSATRSSWKSQPDQTQQLNDKSLLISSCLINGKWSTASSSKTFDVHDPATSQLISTCPECDIVDAEKAIAAANKAFKSYRQLTGRQRSRILRKWYDLMVQNADDIATLITWECGKPVAEAKGETAYAASFLEWFSEEAPRTYGDTYPASVPSRHSFMVKQPIGVCALITPWNFPAAMVTRKAGAALAAGCTVVLKSPGETPFTTNAIAELALRAGVPPGVFNVITALKNTPRIGQALTSSTIVKKVSFTGSTGVGKLLMSQSSSTLKKLSLELGGNAPFIVFDDCRDIDAAVEGCIAAKFRGSGQTCVCANRIYVQSGIYQEFASKLTQKVKQFKVGPGFGTGVTHGPLISPRAVEKVHRHVQDALSKGAIATTGGESIPELGDCFYSPTVLTGMEHTMEVATDETFGPVAGLFEFQSEDEVVDFANRSTVGLAAYVFSSDIDKVYRVSDALEVGMVGINTGLISDPATPFGGIKESGSGKEGSKYGIEEYVVSKAITLGFHKL